MREIATLCVGVSNLCVVQLASSEVEDLDEDLERICPSEVK